MNTPLVLRSTSVPTTERPEFKQALAAAKSIGPRPSKRQVHALAELLKRALRAG